MRIQLSCLIMSCILVILLMYIGACIENYNYKKRLYEYNYYIEKFTNIPKNYVDNEHISDKSYIPYQPVHGKYHAEHHDIKPVPFRIV